jgi:hypothetical protein
MFGGGAYPPDGGIPGGMDGGPPDGGIPGGMDGGGGRGIGRSGGGP